MLRCSVTAVRNDELAEKNQYSAPPLFCASSDKKAEMENHVVDLSNLPVDLLLECMGFGSERELLSLEHTGKSFRAAIRSQDSLWRALLQRRLCRHPPAIHPVGTILSDKTAMMEEDDGGEILANRWRLRTRRFLTRDFDVVSLPESAMPWSQQPSPDQPVPTPRYLHRAAPTMDSGCAVVFGGRGDGEFFGGIREDVLNDMWFFNCSCSGSLSCRLLSSHVTVDSQRHRGPHTPPHFTAPRLTAPSFVWAGGAGFIFGGLELDNQQFTNDLWAVTKSGDGEYSLALVDDKEGSSRPQGRFGHAAAVRRRAPQEMVGLELAYRSEADEEARRNGVPYEYEMWLQGGSAPGQDFSDVWVLSIAVSEQGELVGHTWEELECGGDSSSAEVNTCFPRGRGGHSMTIAGEFLFVFGGNDARNTFNDLWCLPCNRSLRTNGEETPLRWRRLIPSGPEPCTRIGHSAVFVGNLLVLFGGRNFNNNSTFCDGDLWILDLEDFFRNHSRESFAAAGLEEGSQSPLDPISDGCCWLRRDRPDQQIVPRTGAISIPHIDGILIFGGKGLDSMQLPTQIIRLF
jgi:hypothetical protein